MTRIREEEEEEDCGQTVHPRHGTLIGTPTPGIQWYKFRPPGVTPNRGMGPREALFVKLL